MSSEPPFDPGQAHRWFSADCFNRAWDLLERKDRSPEEDERMISLAHAALAHWRDRDDCGNRNLSIGYWQLSRVHAVLGNAERARHYGQRCLEISAGEPPFFLGYAHEAVARAARLAGRALELDLHLKDARELAQKVESAEDRRLLEADLDELEST